jgi:hypothetical protein
MRRKKQLRDLNGGKVTTGLLTFGISFGSFGWNFLGPPTFFCGFFFRLLFFFFRHIVILYHNGGHGVLEPQKLTGSTLLFLFSESQRGIHSTTHSLNNIETLILQLYYVLVAYLLIMRTKGNEVTGF